MDKSAKSVRKDWLLIQKLIEKNRKVLDIGCGEGELIENLNKNKQSDTKGLEINGEYVRKAISKGLVVIQGDAEKDLYQYDDESFDYVILSQTLQAMYSPKSVLLEMLRIGGKVIVSFPNFGHWKIRLKLLATGRMPITEKLPYSWYETPNIHFFTIKDFQEMCMDSNIFIEKSIGISESGRQFEINEKSLLSNLIVNEAIFLLSKSGIEPIKIKSKTLVSSGSQAIQV
ncbi:MAG: hypothetical protein CFH21_00089 [Alphaproteobacteria bacterium MarineAlpha5_Bin11]|nr:methionine biosynthesis protein MetW [Pelagibacteraceae bacterium]PPR45000.1 MAG: hypothetical protein CFH21_00089 [Alphaproteobacteria bacterium MarineAlpha5_Bin11]PPR51406.1 MAG: hypothetical protein CFH20_00599 [Alphaproteobacteria bacterium MarineAlpha5_Bin10]|tara:strand:- start:33520 stop:34206 length:687 start_codon:yes stop_codon:yes gene_type:complete